MKLKEILKHLHSYDNMVEKNKKLSYPAMLVQELMKEVEKTYECVHCTPRE